MLGQLEAIQATVKQPLYIGRGTKTKDSIIYLGSFNNKNIPYLVIATKQIKKSNQLILTAFGTKNLGLNKINKILWQQKKKTPLLLLSGHRRTNDHHGWPQRFGQSGKYYVRYGSLFAMGSAP